MKVAYIRCSSVDQNEARQMAALEKYDIDKYFVEKQSGRTMNREALKELLDYVREGDTVYIKDFSRLSRSTKDLLNLIDQFEEKGVALVSDKEQFDTSTSTGKLMVTMLAAINEFLVTINSENQREGIEIAKKEGKYKGRKPVEVNEEQFANLLEQYKNHELSKSEFANQLGISRPTLYRIFEERNIA